MKSKPIEGAKRISTKRLFNHGSIGRSQEEFITLEKMIYSDRFSYEKVIYRHSRAPVEIVCKKHGPFFVTPDAFHKGLCGPRCRRECFFPIRAAVVPNAAIRAGDKKTDLFRGICQKGAENPREKIPV
jgi:hypothetical protein